MKLFVTSKMAFDPILHEGFERVQPLEKDLRDAHDSMLAADHLVLIFPLWLGTLPAIMKGFLERVLQPDLVPGAKEHRFPKILKGKTARVIITMGMPAFLYRWWFGPYALKMLKRYILSFLGISSVRSMICGNVEGVGPKGRGKWLEQMESLGRRSA